MFFFVLVGTVVAAVAPVCGAVDGARLLGQAGQQLLGALEGGPQRHRPLLQPNLVRVGQHNFALLGSEDDALLILHLRGKRTRRCE